MLDQRMDDVAHIPIDIFERQVEAAIEQYLLDRGAKSALGGLVHVVRGLLRIDKFGRNRAAHENIVIAEIIAMKQCAKHRVIK